MWALYPPGSLARETIDKPMLLDHCKSKVIGLAVYMFDENFEHASIVKAVDVSIAPTRDQEE